MADQQAPDFTLEHVLTGRKISLQDYRGRPVVVTFSGRHSGDQADQIDAALRARFTPEALPMLGVADLHGVPRMMRGFAKERVESAYKKAAAQLAQSFQTQGKPVPEDMSQVLIIMPDFDGSVVSGFGLKNADDQAVAFLIDEQGLIRTSATGPKAGEQLLAFIDSGG